VTDLKPEDFEVFEDRRPQKVTAFSLVNIPVERQQRPLFASKPVEPDVRNNLQGADGRIYLLVLDDLHTTALRSQRTKLAAKMFIERYIGANDLAAVVHTSGRGDAGQDFTSNQRLRGGCYTQPRSATLNKIDDVVTPAPRAIRRRTRTTGARLRARAPDTVRTLPLGNICGRRKAW
jgi:hypothetical protein